MYVIYFTKRLLAASLRTPAVITVSLIHTEAELLWGLGGILII